MIKIDMVVSERAKPGFLSAGLQGGSEMEEIVKQKTFLRETFKTVQSGSKMTRDDPKNHRASLTLVNSI